jgi:UDP-glucuronate decarboxylase
MNYYSRHGFASLSAGPALSPRSPEIAHKTALVTGGAGFLGSHLCDHLLRDGARVLCLDNFATGSLANVAHLNDDPRFVIVRQDVCEPLLAEVDEIYNLACPASPPHYQADPIQTMRTNVLGALNVLELARRRDIPVFQASTSEVYGDPQVHPQPEGYWGNVNPIGPRSCYDEGKRAAETLFFDFARVRGTKIKVVRIFNTYGPRMRPDDGRVVSNFIVQALKGDDITIYGDGSQTRSFCYVEDLIEGFVRFMRAPAHVMGPINLGNPGEFTIREFAGLIVDITNSRSRIIHVPLPIDDPRQRRPDITRADRLLGWQPRIPLVDGLARTITFFDALLSAGREALPETVV